MVLYHYELSKTLGRGSFGTVYLATHKETKAKYAIKIIEKSNDSKAMQEVEILKKTSHEFIIKYYQYLYHWKGDEERKLCIVLEYADYGTLESAVLESKSSNAEHNIWRSIWQISSALSYLHGLKVICCGNL